MVLFQRMNGALDNISVVSKTYQRKENKNDTCRHLLADMIATNVLKFLFIHFDEICMKSYQSKENIQRECFVTNRNDSILLLSGDNYFC